MRPSSLLHYALALLCGVALCGEAAAKHIVGGEVTYACIGQPDDNSRTYAIEVYLYRDATGGGALFDSDGRAPTFEMTVFRGQRIFGRYEIFRNGLTIEVLPIVDPDPCVIYPPNLRTESGRYVTEITLPISDETYTVSYQRCCRNEVISNVVNPGDAGATYLVEIPPLAQRTCNASPVFNSLAPLVICVDQQLEFDHAATDREGDELRYSLCNPFLGGGPQQGDGAESLSGVTPNPESAPPYRSLAFRPPFAAQAPLDSEPPMSIDAATGLLRVRPGTQGVFVLCVSVEEYRDGELIGEVRRDFQFNVVSCTPLVEAAVTSLDAALDSSRTTGFIQICGATGASLVNISSGADITGQTWFFPGTLNGDVTLSNSVERVDYPDYGEYPARMIVNPDDQCRDTIDFNLRFTPPTFSDFEFAYDTCVYGPIEFTNNSRNARGAGLQSFTWDFGDSRTSDDFEPSYLYEQAGVRRITLTARDEFGCEADTVREIDYFPVPAFLSASVDADQPCSPALVGFRQNIDLFTDDYDIFWDFGNGDTSGEIDPDYRYETPGTYDIYLSATSPFGCFVDTSFVVPLRVRPSPVSDFLIDPPTADIREPTVRYYDESTEAVSWQWFFDSVGTSREVDPEFTFPDTGLYRTTLIVSHLSGCLDTSSQLLRVEPFASYFLPNAFTPNGDGDNEVFVGVSYSRLISDFEMRIFNRWGEIVFETRDIDEGWDGRNRRNGGDAPPGVYLYVVDYTDHTGDHRLEGFSTLIR